MEEVPGSMGTSAGLALRLGQTIFSSASLLFMSLDVQFYSYTAFWRGVCYQHERTLPARVADTLILVATFIYLVTVMGLVIPWSVTMALVDVYSVFVKSLPRQPRIVSIVIVGDLVLSLLTLAAASSTASVTDLMLDAGRSYCPGRLCSRYQLSAAMAFLSWFLSFASSLFNLWLLPSL